MGSLIALIKIGVILFAGLTALLFFFQGRLIFYPQNISSQDIQTYKPYEIIIESSGNRLHGWFVNRGISAESPLIIYYGGNAEEVSLNLPDLERFDTGSFLFMNYRGYGASQGSPGESALFQDALTLFDFITSRESIPASHVLLMGRSLGSAVATFVAAKRSVGGVILVTPFDSLVSVAKKHYPIFPVNLLLRHRFDSARFAPGINTPMLAIIAGRDEIIPNKSSMALVSQWSGPVSVARIEDAGHNDISMNRHYWQTINDFIRDRMTAGIELVQPDQ